MNIWYVARLVVDGKERLGTAGTINRHSYTDIVAAIASYGADNDYNIYRFNGDVSSHRRLWTPVNEYRNGQYLR